MKNLKTSITAVATVVTLTAPAWARSKPWPDARRGGTITWMECDQ
jgi:hypothetical protein